MNPGTRLLLVLKKIKTTPGNTSSLKAWETFFNVAEQEDSKYLVLNYFSKIIRLTYLVEDQLKTIENLNFDLYKPSIHEVRALFINHNFGENWDAFRKKINPQTLRGLEFIADAISNIYSEEEVPKETLDEIRSKIDDLFEEVLKSNIDHNIRTFISASLIELLNAIRNYQVFGAEGIRESLAKVLGNTWIEKKSIIDSTGEEKSLLDKTMVVLKKTGEMLNITRYGQKLILDFGDQIEKLPFLN
jgi:hypothetical protein